MVELYCDKFHMKVGGSMTRGGKVLFSFIALVLGTFLFTVFVHYQFVYSLNIRFIKPEEYPLIGNYMPFYFYWGSVIGMAILALVILWIILRPTEVTSIKLSEDKGKLEIKKRDRRANSITSISNKLIK
ncbi:alkaline shock response membrane anchor protein AmaP [Enterococcus faecium]|nr:alkaline shock response membrane anchor protein AmaP [Enterococcus faecium]